MSPLIGCDSRGWRVGGEEHSPASTPNGGVLFAIAGGVMGILWKAGNIWCRATGMRLTGVGVGRELFAKALYGFGIVQLSAVQLALRIWRSRSSSMLVKFLSPMVVGCLEVSHDTSLELVVSATDKW